MSSTNNIFKFRFYDNNITPESFSLKELGKLLINVEDSVKSIVDLQYPNINVENVKLSLINIENKSESLNISTLDSPKEAIDSFLYWGESIQKESYVNLPDKAYEGYKFVHNIIEKKQCKAEITYIDKQLFDISYSTPFVKQEEALINIDTMIYGELIKIGGDHAKAWIQLTNGSNLNFQTSKEDAMKLSPNLYKMIGLKGQAKWNPKSNYISAFKLFDILEYKQGNVANAFKKLREITSGEWDKYNTSQAIKNALEGEND
jgi:hypothetical protein